MSGAVRSNMIATISPSPYSKPLLLDLVSPAPHEFFVGVALSGVFLVGKGGAGAPYSYSIISGSLPTGLSLDGTTGEISGTPSAQGVVSFVAQVEDSASNTFAHGFTINVQSGLFVVIGTPTPGEEDLAYQFQFIVRDLTGTTITSGYTVSVGTLPDGLGLASNGFVTGTPTALAVGVTWVTINVASGGVSLDIPCSFTIYPVLMFGASSVPNIIRGASYTAFIHATGGMPPYRYSYGPVASGLDGIVMDGGTGDVSGSTDATSGTYTGGMTVQDALGVIISQTTAWIVQDANRYIQPQNNSSDVGTPNPKNFDFIDGTNTTATVTNDGTTVTVKIDATTGGSGVATVTGDIVDNTDPANPVVDDEGSLTLSIGRQGGPILQSGTYRTFLVPGKYTGASNWWLAADPSATCSIDIWYRAFGATWPTSGDSIVSTHYPALSAANHATGTTSGWGTTAFAQGGYITFYLRSNDVATQIIFELQATKTL